MCFQLDDADKGMPPIAGKYLAATDAPQNWPAGGSTSLSLPSSTSNLMKSMSTPVISDGHHQGAHTAGELAVISGGHHQGAHTAGELAVISDGHHQGAHTAGELAVISDGHHQGAHTAGELAVVSDGHHQGAHTANCQT